MKDDLWIAIPTYWGASVTDPSQLLVNFDHPTALGTEGTIERALSSLKNLEDDFTLLIILAVDHPSIAQKAHCKVLSIAEKFAGSFPTYLVSPENLDPLNKALNEPILSLGSYGSIRNVQLCIPYIMGATAVVGIDDDEIVEDPLFLSKVTKYIGREYNGDIVGGLAGPYYDRNGNYRNAGAKELRDVENMFIKKNYYIDSAIEQAMATETEITRSNVAFGGNMTISRDTAKKACHDTYIPRGEDYDYVINAKMKGISFYFQPSMSIVHLPPDSTSAQARDNVLKLIADIRRFIYMRQKMIYHLGHYVDEAFDRDYLMPYPGVYLDPKVDLEAQGIESLKSLYPEYCANFSPELIVEEASAVAETRAEEYFQYRDKWEAMTDFVDRNPILKDQITPLYRINP